MLKQTSFDFNQTKFSIVCPLCFNKISIYNQSFLYFFKFYKRISKNDVCLKSFIVHDRCQFKYFLLNMTFSVFFLKWRLCILKKLID